MSGAKQEPSPSSSTSPAESLVIQKYIQGKSMNLISKETQISKGKVHYLIKNWKERLEGSDIEKIREFSNLVKSSNVSIEQCAQGFRIINILKSFGIWNLDISDDGEGNDDYKDIDNHTNDNYNEFFSFVKEIYNNCKKLEIP